MPRWTQTVEERLWSNTDRESIPGCWLWSRWCSYKGYGTLRIGNKQHYTHRLSWELSHGPIPIGMFVCHHCDHPACINPDHLFLGTAADNRRDAKIKGRLNYKDKSKRISGERNGSAKLTEAAVLEIRELHTEGMAVRALAEKFGIVKSQAQRIINREYWKHI